MKLPLLLLPTRGRVLFRRETLPDVTAGGIDIPDVAKRPSQWGICVAVGREVEDVHPGDRVLVDLYQGVELDYGAQVLWLVDADKVLATG